MYTRIGTLPSLPFSKSVVRLTGSWTWHDYDRWCERLDRWRAEAHELTGDCEFDLAQATRLVELAGMCSFAAQATACFEARSRRRRWVMIY